MSDMQTTDALLPCPFCGEQPAVYTDGEDWIAVCTNGDCPTEPGCVLNDTREDAVRKWNTRAAVPDRAEGPIETADTGGEMFLVLRPGSAAWQPCWRLRYPSDSDGNCDDAEHWVIVEGCPEDGGDGVAQTIIPASAAKGWRWKSLNATPAVPGGGGSARRARTMAIGDGTMKLNAGQMHLLRLTARDAAEDGWASVSETVWPLIASIPDDLAEKRPSEKGGHIRLTDHGKTVLFYS